MIQNIINIENQINAVFRMRQDGKITDNEFVEVYNSLQRSQKLLAKMIKEFEKNIKQGLELTDRITVNNYEFYFKTVQKKVFDNSKAKKTLENLNYSLEDFYTIQKSKTLVNDLKK